jgi:CheY-like chemotaxis protein
LKPRILVFDTDQAITQQLFWTLCEDYDVVTSNDLPTALRRVASYQPVVALVELSADARNDSADTGLRIVDYLKCHLPRSRVLGMTSEVRPESKKKLFGHGVDELLDKPFETEQLLGLLRRLAPLRSFDSAESGASKLCY